MLLKDSKLLGVRNKRESREKEREREREREREWCYRKIVNYLKWEIDAGEEWWRKNEWESKDGINISIKSENLLSRGCLSSKHEIMLEFVLSSSFHFDGTVLRISLREH